MTDERQQIYAKLLGQIGNTPLVEVTHLPLPNGCRVFAKCEFLGPTGSHHDRQFVRLFMDAEESGEIVPGKTPLVEVTSGCAGASFAWVAKELGYEATVIVPKELPKNRVRSITRHGCCLLRADGDYIRGCVRLLKAWLKGNPSLYCMNHSRKAVSASALSDIVHEAVRQEPGLNAYVALAGSGSSLLGPGMAMLDYGGELLAWEPWASGVAFDMQNPGEYQRTYGVDPGTVQHQVWGGSFAGIEFPHLKEAVRLLSDRVCLVADSKQGGGFGLPRWDKVDTTWPVGRSSLGNLAAVQHFAKTRENVKFLTAFYDASNNY